MKTIAITLLSIIAGYWLFSQGEWHTDRNKNNRLPIGTLRQIDKQFFKDSLGQTWRLQPNNKNELHQPNSTIEKPLNPYPNVKGDIKFNSNYPNLKFTCSTKNGCSFEAILQPSGNFLLEGPKRGTFNYAHPNGFIGNLKHLLIDLLPHLLNANYH